MNDKLTTSNHETDELLEELRWQRNNHPTTNLAVEPSVRFHRQRIRLSIALGISTFGEQEFKLRMWIVVLDLLSSFGRMQIL